MADDQLDQLENRITLLECLVFGTSDKDALYPKCIDSIHNVQTKTNAAVQGKKRISQTYSKLADIQQYLDPSYTDEMTVSDSAKADTIMADEDFIRQQTARLETMESIQDCINSEYMKALPKNTTKFQELSQAQLSQQDKTAEVTDEVRNILSAYNNIVSMVSKQFVQWDEIITKLEMAKLAKK
ncbi:dynactin subunit 3-like isoform X2 [Mizuhopecten yessoensis]|uniref:Dynactin subunit 3 n=1 Tax=Mizuhopecten yessoensis TaxID=6573 RepID=A0A210QX62_MIZYE|nr:dynactin subunit 3-like isoform X2 [Mizuhopecten yessoensis]OWF53314.1 Dynactin subunit 3 [Mizuhopecten yessoensis]